MRKLTQRKYKAKGGDYQEAVGGETILNKINAIGGTIGNKFSKINIMIGLDYLGQIENSEVITMVTNLINSLPVNYQGSNISGSIAFYNPNTSPGI